MKKYSITVGIPTFNEEENIKYLIADLLVQKQVNIKIEKIIISDDKSSDDTVKIAKQFRKKIISVIENKKRTGQAQKQNQIFEKSNTDIVVLLNADVMIKDRSYLEKIVRPIINNQADLTSTHIQEIDPRSFIEKVIFLSMKIKHKLFEELKSGDNVYTCHGPARAFSRNLYKKIRFGASVGEDAYSYLYTKKNNFKYKYVKNTYVKYKLPGTFSDHKKQSMRFLASLSRFNKEFGRNFVKNEYKIPNKLLFKYLFKFLRDYPMYAILYVFIYAFMNINSIFNNDTKDKWDISKSSKKLRANI